MAKRVLIVDEDCHVVRLVRRHLEDQGHEVVTAHDASEALQKVAADKPEVILLGPKLPSRDEVLRALKANPQTRGIPVVGADWLPPPRA